jgi:phage FluMu protein Com
MAIEFRCTHCQRLLRTPDGTSGKDAKCPECGTIVRIPELAASAVSSPAEGAHAITHSSDNPYAAPSQSDPARGADADDDALRPTRIEIGDIFDRTWQIFKVHWAACTGAAWALPFVVAIGSLPLVAIYVLVGLASKDDPLPWVFGGIALGAAVAWLCMLMTLGLHAFMLKIARGEPTTVRDLFVETSLVIPALLATLLVALAATIGFALLIVPGIIVGLMFSQFINIMIDRQVGVIDALRLSMQVTEGNKLTLFLLGLLMAAVHSIGTSLTCGLFTIVFVPFSWLLASVAYLAMTGQRTAHQAPVEHERTLHPGA